MKSIGFIVLIITWSLSSYCQEVKVDGNQIRIGDSTSILNSIIVGGNLFRNYYGLDSFTRMQIDSISNHMGFLTSEMKRLLLLYERDISYSDSIKAITTLLNSYKGQLTLYKRMNDSIQQHKKVIDSMRVAKGRIEDKCNRITSDVTFLNETDKTIDIEYYILNPDGHSYSQFSLNRLSVNANSKQTVFNLEEGVYSYKYMVYSTRANRIQAQFKVVRCKDQDVILR
jgi:hypothetical protein